MFSYTYLGAKMSLSKALVAIGFGNSEAKIVTYLLDHGKSTFEEVMDGANLSRATVYSNLRSLTNKGYVERSDKRPYSYSPTPRLLSDVKTKFIQFYRKVSSEIKPRRIVERRTMLRRICTIFEKNGYAIRDPSRASMEHLVRRFDTVPAIDKIADGEYSFGVFLLDKTKKVEGSSERIARVLLRDMWYITRELNLVSSFVFVHTDRRGYKTLIKRLKQASTYPDPYRLLRQRVEHFGITGKPIFVINTDEDLSDIIPGVLQEIHQRRIIVGNMVKNLKEKMNQIQELMLLSKEHARGIDGLFLTGSPFQKHTLVTKRLNEIADPVQRIKNREIRNMGIFRRKFSENEVRITQSLEAIERRIYLPRVGRIERYLTELESTIEKFKCIEYELNDLRSALFKYGVSMIEFEDKALINPFIFTEPYEREPFFVNEGTLIKAATSLSKSMQGNLPGFFQILKGNAGIGKTHAARYIYGPIVEKEHLKSLYIDCPLNYDLISGIFQELTQESLFPTEMVGTIRELRRNIPSTPRDLLRVIEEISEIWKKQGYKGLLLVLDEIENAVPYAFLEERRINAPRARARRHQPPLALRQIREILSLHPIPNLGFLFCCRSKIYPILKEALRVRNLDTFTFEPEKLKPKDFFDLLLHRYEMWSIEKGPQFEKATIREIIRITDGNTRDVIKYLRELFEFAVRNELRKIDKSRIKEIGAIPLFRY